MKHLITSLAFLFISLCCKSQILLPKDFICKKNLETKNEYYFTNGSIIFSTYAWGHDGIDGLDLINHLETSQKLKFKRTKDGIYWATGCSSGSCYYTLIVHDVLQFTVYSKTNNSRFSNLSAWLLQEIRNKILAENENLYLTDYQGRSCF